MRVVEVTGNAGDIVLVHPWLLHVRPVNGRSKPHFLLAKDLRRRASRPPASGLRANPVGEPDAVNPHVRFDERGSETERWNGMRHRHH
ncbi:MAG: hypothetical protein ACREA0_03720, partial [bacterium]